MKFLDFSKLYTEYPEVDQAVKLELVCGRQILSDALESFESNFAARLGKNFAVGVSSGTHAILASLRALGVGEGDQVITTDHTFKSTVGAIVDVGAKPVTVDIDEYGLIDIDEVEKAINPKVKAIIPVHIAGDVVDMSRLMDVAHSIPVIEDACQAVGALGVGWGVTQCYSHYPAKILGCYGDGGSVATDDEDIADYIRETRNHDKNDNEVWGYNERLDNIQAAVLNVKLDRLNEDVDKREKVAKRYNKAFKDIPAQTPRETLGRVYQDYILRTKQRDELYEYLKENDIETMKNEYPFIINWNKKPKTKEYEAETLRLPCNQFLTITEINNVITNVKNYFEM